MAPLGHSLPLFVPAACVNARAIRCAVSAYDQDSRSLRPFHKPTNVAHKKICDLRCAVDLPHGGAVDCKDVASDNLQTLVPAWEQPVSMAIKKQINPRAHRDMRCVYRPRLPCCWIRHRRGRGLLGGESLCELVSKARIPPLQQLFPVDCHKDSSRRMIAILTACIFVGDHSPGQLQTFIIA